MLMPTRNLLSSARPAPPDHSCWALRGSNGLPKTLRFFSLQTLELGWPRLVPHSDALHLQCSSKSLSAHLYSIFSGAFIPAQETL